MNKLNWTHDMISALTTHYPRMSTPEAAAIVGVSVSSAKRKAKELGLKKGLKSDTMQNIIILRENFSRNSFAELAQMMNTSKTSVARLADKLGLIRTNEAERSIRSRVRREISRRDRIRILIGMPPLTRIIERN